MRPRPGASGSPTWNGTRPGARRTPGGRRGSARSRRDPTTRSARAGSASARQAIAIHGTPRPDTVGRRSSHGCVRMRIRRVEWLSNVVRLGTAVKIV
ncbi:L,D-transpeptidase [Miltoncostaea marina]|uniref:L,D-transpeptidase n=1 Tax=Miltoncostaea marina TaxID=2843215 RepID=UPI003CCE64A0